MLLELGSHSWIRKPLLEGFITSAGAGSESLVQATRAAFAADTKQLGRDFWTTDGVTFTTTVMVRLNPSLFLIDCRMARVKQNPS